MKPAESTTREEFGPYLVYEQLGIGGMATVHRAKKRGIAGFERGVALKRMLPHLADDAEFIRSFVREAKLASLLVHPNIAQIYDFGRVGSVYYIAMEHVDGFDVRKMLRHSHRHRDLLPLPVVLSILCELCDALEYAHTFVDERGQPQGIVHRDVSPSNLIVAHSGHLKVIDFGIAKASTCPRHTQSGRVKGKLGYMSPETVSGRAFGPASDVFSAGVVAHELLTACPLFSARTDYETLHRIREAEIPPPSRRNPSVPAALDEIVLTALARDPERRLPSAGAFRQGLEDVAEQAGIRFSVRDVAEWRARVATSEDPWGSRSSLLARSPAGASRSISVSSSSSSSSSVSSSFSFPESRNSSSLPGLNPRALSQRVSLRHAAPEPRANPGSGAATPATPAASATSARPGSDDERAVANLAWGSDVAPARPLHSIADQGAAPTNPPPLAPPAIGASIITAAAPGRHSVLRHALILLGSTAAVLAVYPFVRRPGTPSPPPPPAITSIRFVVQPADAVVEIGGKEAARQSPFETQLGPGVYSIRVRRDGYQPWTREVALRDGDRPTIQVALDPGTAQLTVSSQPPDLGVQLDGQQLDQVTAVAHPPLPAAPERNDRKDRAERSKRPIAVPARIARKEPAEPEIRAEPLLEPPPAIPAPSAPAPAPAPLPAPALPRPAAPPPAPSKAPPLVAPTAVTKLAGEIPAMKITGATEAFADVIAKMCIDEHGRVATVRIVKALPEIADELQRSLAGWRYRPYSNAAGQASPACFPLSLRVVFKRSN